MSFSQKSKNKNTVCSCSDPKSQSIPLNDFFFFSYKLHSVDFSDFYLVLATKGFSAENLLTAKLTQSLPLSLANMT